MADFATTVPIAQALWPAAEAYLHRQLVWVSSSDGNRLQELIVALKDPSLALAWPLIERGELTAKASSVCAEINKFLEDNGFSLQLQDRGSLNVLYVASILKLLGKFNIPGETDYFLPRINKPAFRLEMQAGVTHFIFNGQTVVAVPTSGDFHFLLTKPTGTTGFDMLADWQKILHGMHKVQGNGVILPFVQIGETEVGVSSLAGIKTDDERWKIEEALVAVKFSLTPIRVRFEAAFASSLRFMGISPYHEPEWGDYVADHSLYFALVRSGNWLPLVVGLVDANELSDDDKIR